MFTVLDKKKYVSPIADKVIVDGNDELLGGLGPGAGSEMLAKPTNGVFQESKKSYSNDIWDN